MSARSHRAVALAVVLVAVATPALAEGVGMVSGRVTDERGKPMDNVMVSLSSPGVLGTMRAVTDAEGRYWFPAVPGNHVLHIRAEVAGRVPVEYVGHKARRNGSTRVDFRLRQPGDHLILVLIEDGVPYHRTALDGAISTMPGVMELLIVQGNRSGTVKELKRRIEQRPSAVLAIGDEAARLARRHVKDVPIVYSMVPAPLEADLTTANICGVPLNGGFETQVDRLLQVMPDARRIGTIYDPHRLSRPFASLKQAASAAGLDLIAAHVHDGDDVDITPLIEHLEEQDIDAFFLLMDPLFLDTRRFGEILEFAERRDLLLAVPDASLGTSGKSIAEVPGFWELGAYSGTLVRRILEGKMQPSQIGMTFPDQDFFADASVPPPHRSPDEVLPGEQPDRPVRLALDE